MGQRAPGWGCGSRLWGRGTRCGAEGAGVGLREPAVGRGGGGGPRYRPLGGGNRERPQRRDSPQPPLRSAAVSSRRLPLSNERPHWPATRRPIGGLGTTCGAEPGRRVTPPSAYSRVGGGRKAAGHAPFPSLLPRPSRPRMRDAAEWGRRGCAHARGGGKCAWRGGGEAEPRHVRLHAGVHVGSHEGGGVAPVPGFARGGACASRRGEGTEQDT